MAMRCATCGIESPDRFRFCGACGAPLTAPAPAPADVAAEAPVEDGDRRQVTILFCDLVGSTELAHRLDPEDWREVIRAWQDTSADVVTSLGGHVAHYVGDAVKAYFGYPQAREDDGLRALRAALALLDAMARLGPRLPMLDTPLHVRVGVHTGLVVTGEIAGEKGAAVGETPIAAARLQTLADPDTIFVSDATRKLAPDRFAFEDRGTHTLKGIGKPVHVYRLLGETAQADRLDAFTPSSLAPLMGRERELRLLVDRWEQARGGRGQVVLISGESGIGKSRLLHAFREAVGASGHRWLICRCNPDSRSSALFPVIQLIQQEIGVESEDAPATRLEKLKASLESYDQAGAEALAAFTSLLSLPLPRMDPLADQGPDVKKRRTIDALLAWLLALARRQPLVVCAEDLHWADPSSLEFLQLVLRAIEHSPILVLLTHRPEISFPLAVRANVREFRLARLARADVIRIVEAMTSGRRLPGEVIDQIVSRTDGVPLFVEELVKMVLESELLVEKDGAFVLSGPLPPLAIPSTLQDSLTARLDRLGTAKETAQLAAVVGREFTCGMLCAVSGKDETSMRETLDRLVASGLVYPYSAAIYAFKHALVQEAAYNSLLKSRRQLIHRQVADALATNYPDVVKTQPELLAHHYASAGLAESSLQYWLQAGERAGKRSAFPEAIIHLRRGLDALQSMPESTERMGYELQFQVALGDALIAVLGYGAPQVGAAYGRARELCQQVGDQPQLGFVLGGVWVYYLIRADYSAALELAQQLMRLSEQMPLPLLVAGAHTAMGATLMNLGDIEAARTHLSKAVEYGERDQLVLASDLRVSGLCFLANVLAALGEVEQAVLRVDEALARARDLGKPFFLANALTQAAWIHQLAGDVDRAESAANAAFELTVEQGFPYWKTFCLMTQGWVLIERGEIEQGLAKMMRSQSVAHETGTERFTSARLATHAEGYLRAGRAADALASLDRAREHVERTGERFCEAELLRLRGEILARTDSVDAAREADECFRQALDLGRRQGAKLWERRARASIAARAGR